MQTFDGEIYITRQLYFFTPLAQAKTSKLPVMFYKISNIKNQTTRKCNKVWNFNANLIRKTTISLYERPTFAPLNRARITLGALKSGGMHRRFASTSTWKLNFQTLLSGQYTRFCLRFMTATIGATSWTTITAIAFWGVHHSSVFYFVLSLLLLTHKAQSFLARWRDNAALRRPPFIPHPRFSTLSIAW